MRSSTTPPLSSQHIVYCALPVVIRPRSLVRQAVTKAAAPGPVTDALPRWLTSKMPTRSRTAVCSRNTPPPGYSIGISQPPKSASLAPRATCRECRGECRSPVMAGNVPKPGPGPRGSRPSSAGHSIAVVTSLRISDKSPADVKADVLVIGVAAGPDGPVLPSGRGAPELPRALRTSLTGSLTALGLTGKADQVIRIPSGGAVAAAVLVLTGLGQAPTGRTAEYDAEALRRAAGAATRSLSGTASVAVALPAADAKAIGAIAEGALIGAYVFSRHRSRTAKDAKPAVSSVTVLGANPREKAIREAAARAEAVCQAVTLTRDLVNTAPGDLPPAAL